MPTNSMPATASTDTAPLQTPAVKQSWNEWLESMPKKQRFAVNFLSGLVQLCAFGGPLALAIVLAFIYYPPCTKRAPGSNPNVDPQHSPISFEKETCTSPLQGAIIMLGLSSGLSLIFLFHLLLLPYLAKKYAPISTITPPPPEHAQARQNGASTQPQPQQLLEQANSTPQALTDSTNTAMIDTPPPSWGNYLSRTSRKEKRLFYFWLTIGSLITSIGPAIIFSALAFTLYSKPVEDPSNPHHPTHQSSLQVMCLALAFFSPIILLGILIKLVDVYLAKKYTVVIPTLALNTDEEEATGDSSCSFFNRLKKYIKNCCSSHREGYELLEANQLKA